MNRQFQKSCFLILIVRPPQNADDTVKSEEISEETDGNLIEEMLPDENEAEDIQHEVSRPGSQGYVMANQWSLDGVDNWLERLRDLTPDIAGDTFEIFFRSDAERHSLFEHRYNLCLEKSGLKEGGTSISRKIGRKIPPHNFPHYTCFITR